MASLRRSVRVSLREELSTALAALGLVDEAPVIVVVGGAARMGDDETGRVRAAFVEAVVPAADAAGAVVVDGGTAVGVMRLMGEARTARDAGFPLVGVVVEQLTRGANSAELDEGHTHFVLVPGRSWGDEAKWLSDSAAVLAGGRPSVTVLANGGEIAWHDVAHSIEAGRPVIVLDGSGRTADELAAGASPRARALTKTGLVRVVAVDDADAVREAIATAVCGG